jgi:S-adenosyl-L-methionine hydrolase (adenosine-forming)
MILLFTDFGSTDVYVGQLKLALTVHAPEESVIDLLHEVPNFDLRAGAHLLAALHERIPESAVTMAIVDPGVGSARDPLVVMADGRWYVGPDNGLLSVVLSRAHTSQIWRICWSGADISNSFHGRDLFAPIAAMLAKKEWWADALIPVAKLNVMFGSSELREVIYIDHYGNAMTGIPATAANHSNVLRVGSHTLHYARVFSDVDERESFWYPNSIGLAEIAMNCGDAAQALMLSVGDEVDWLPRN